jgi:hypothetical protein
MKKVLLFFFSAIASFQLQAQLLVNLQLPAIGLSIKPQLWNMVLVNTGAQVLNLNVDMVFTDITNNQIVMTASTARFNLSPGSHAFAASDFIPIVYNVVNSSYNINNSPNGFLPVGHFNVCYNFNRYISDAFDRIAEECETVEVEPISPPLLVFPEDEAVLETPRPVFNWLPPAPLNFFNSLSYDITLVQVNGTQAPADAVQQNVPVFSQQNIVSEFTPYPGSLAALDTGKLYAWNVTAKNNNAAVASSDIWTFRIGQFGSAGNNNISGGAFARLRKDGSINYFLCPGSLRIAYDNYINDDTVAVTIYDLSNRHSVMQLDSNFIRLKFGQNMLEKDLTSLNGFTNDHLYEIELINSKKEKWKGRFYYKTENNPQ